MWKGWNKKYHVARLIQYLRESYKNVEVSSAKKKLRICCCDVELSFQSGMNPIKLSEQNDFPERIVAVFVAG